MPLGNEGFDEDSAGGVQHRISRSEIVAAAVGEDEKEQRDEIHPGDWTEVFCDGRGETEIESGEPERERGKGEGDLIEEEEFR